jgi:hypothetical protein
MSKFSDEQIFFQSFANVRIVLSLLIYKIIAQEL